MTKTAEDLAARISGQLRVRGNGLEEVSSKAGRKLPRHLQAEVRVVIEAMEMSEHPKLMHHVDTRRVSKAVRKLEKFLAKQDPAAERRGELLDRIAAVAFVLFAIGLALFFILVSRGVFDT